MNAPAGPPEAPYPAIAALLRHRRTVARGTAAAVLLAGVWLAWRAQWPELVLLGAVLAGAAHFVVRVAVEVVALVAETLMPQ